ETLYPGRVDLGIGRAPGTDSDTAALIYRTQYVRTSKFVEAIKGTTLTALHHEGINIVKFIH
ncbi:MAG: hypothetical protein ACFN4M_00350, partial [Segatella salivae]